MSHSRKLAEVSPEIEIEIEIEKQPQIITEPKENLALFSLKTPQVEEVNSTLEEVNSTLYYYNLPQKIGQTMIRFTNAFSNMSWYALPSLSSPAAEMIKALAICINAIVDDVSTEFSLRPLSHFNSVENPAIRKKLMQATCLKLSALLLTGLLGLVLGEAKKNFAGNYDKNNYELGSLLNNLTFGESFALIIEYTTFRTTETLGLKLWEYLSPSPEEAFLDRPDLNSAQEGTRYIKRAATDLAILNYTNSYSLSSSDWTKYAILVDASLKLANYFCFKINPDKNLDIRHGCIAQCGPQEPPLGESERSVNQIIYQGAAIRTIWYGLGAFAAYIFANTLNYTFPDEFETHPYRFKITFASIVIGTDYLARNSKRLCSDIKTLGQKTGLGNAISSLKNCYSTFFNKPKITPETTKLLVDPSKEDTFRIVV